MNDMFLLGMPIIVGLVALITIGIIISKLYKRSTKELAFVRTGLGGEKVILNGGAIVLPVFHEVTKVNMQTLRLEVKRAQSQALITGDRMRVDVQAEFYVRVKPEIRAIAQAAQALGHRTLNTSELKELIEGKFVDALRSVAAEMEMTELHEKRADFVQKVQQVVAEDLLKNGLELETVSLTGLDQTSKEHFNPDNAFDAEGLLQLTQEIEERRKKRNDIERDTQVQIQQKNLQTQKESLTIAKEEEYAKLEMEKEVAFKKAEQEAQIASKQAEQIRESENSKIISQQEIEQSKILNERKTEEARIIKQKAIKLAEQQKAIEIYEKSKAESNAQAEANAARAEAAKAEEKVLTARDLEVANRNKLVQIVEAEKEAQKDAVAIKVSAEAEKVAAEDKAESYRLKAQGEADGIIIKAKADEQRYKVEAEGERMLNEAANSLSAEQIAMRVKLDLIKMLPEIINQSVKPMEHIDSIKILQVDGMNMNTAGIDGEAQSSSLSDQVVSSALKYKAQAPLVESLLGELGIKDVSDLSSLTRNQTNMQDTQVQIKPKQTKSKMPNKVKQSKNAEE